MEMRDGWLKEELDAMKREYQEWPQHLKDSFELALRDHKERKRKNGNGE